jgi:prophage regulatory protein
MVQKRRGLFAKSTPRIALTCNTARVKKCGVYFFTHESGFHERTQQRISGRLIPVWPVRFKENTLMTTPTLNLSGTRCLSPRKVCEKFDRRKSWLWSRVKDDPAFPKPIYLTSGSPVFIEAELDAYLERCRLACKEAGVAHASSSSKKIDTQAMLALTPDETGSGE